MSSGGPGGVAVFSYRDRSEAGYFSPLLSFFAICCCVSLHGMFKSAQTTAQEESTMRTTSIWKTTRRLMVLGLLATLTGCAIPETPPEDVGPPAPKTTAELLVGKWKLVPNDPGLSDRRPSTVEFFPNGDFVASTFDPIKGPWTETGTYTLEGNRIVQKIPKHSIERRGCITSITSEKFNAVDLEFAGGREFEFVRDGI